MQVSARISYPDAGQSRTRFSTSRPWTGDPVLPISQDERASGYRGNLTRGSQQQVNERGRVGSADMEVFVARSLSSTLAMLQMHVTPEAAQPSETTAVEVPGDAAAVFLHDLFAGVLSN